METPNVHETVRDMRHDAIDTIVAEAIPQNSFAEQWDAEKLKASSVQHLVLIFRLRIGLQKMALLRKKSRNACKACQIIYG